MIDLRRVFSLLFVLSSLAMSGCFHEQLAEEDQGQNNDQCETNCGGEEEDPNALYGGFFHWENYQPDLSNAVGVLVLDRKLMKLTTSGTLESMFVAGGGDDQEQSHDVHVGQDNKLYFSQNAGCYEATGYCQCVVVAVDLATNAVSCAFQPDAEYKWGIASGIHTLADGTLFVSAARGDNTAEEIWKVKDGVSTKLYSSNELLDVHVMDNGGIFVEEQEFIDNVGHQSSVYLPAAGGASIPISDTVIHGIVTKLNGANDTNYYILLDKGYYKFDPATETLSEQVYMGKTFYTADGYMNVGYDEIADEYSGYEITDTNLETLITLAAGDVTSHAAEIVLTSDQALALGSPDTPLFTIEVNDETHATEQWMLTNWGLHSWDLPNVPTAVDLGLNDLTNIREVSQVNGQSIVIAGGSYNSPHYLKHYYPDGGSGALSIDLLAGVLEGDVEVSNIAYDPAQQHLVFSAKKTFDKGTATERTEYYVGYNPFVVSDTATHSGAFAGTSLITIEGSVLWRDFVFLP